MEPPASQSADFEPTPPLQRHDSKNNVFLQHLDGSESPRTSSLHSLGVRCSQGSPKTR